MALARTWSVGLTGVHGAMVEVEVDLSAGLPTVVLVGLPDAVVRQSVDRVRAAVVNAGHEFPLRRVTIGLSPAAMPKQGSGFDLALAVAVLAGAKVLPAARVRDLVLLGELGLDGSVRAVRGVLPAVLAAAQAGHRQVVVPADNADEAGLVEGIEVLAATTLGQVVAHLRGKAPLPAHVRAEPAPLPPGPDLADVVGQAAGRRAAEVAAAGGHHLFLSGPPGAGKTMLAERLPGLLPPLDEQAALEVTAIASIAGTLPPGAPLVTRPTFESPHHSATMAALVGGGRARSAPARCAAPIAACSSSTRRPSSPARSWTPSASRWNGARSPSRAPPAPRRSRAARSWYWRRTPAPAPPPPGTPPAPAARSRGAATSPGCPGRCSTGSTCGWTCPRSPAPPGSTAWTSPSPPRRWPHGWRRPGPRRRSGCAAAS